MDNEAEKYYIRFEVRENNTTDVMEKQFTSAQLEYGTMTIYDQLDQFKSFLLMQGFSQNLVNRIEYVEED